MFYIFLINVALIISVQCKQYKRCQLARELYWRHKIPEKDLPVWLCITYKSSRYNTDIIDTKKGNYGMFQINKQFCYEFSDEQLENKEKLCNVPCEAFVDYDIKDDIECVKKIFNEAKYFLGNGFLGWELYKKCKGPRSKLYIKGCNYRKPPKRKINKQKIDNELTTVNSILSIDKNISEITKKNVKTNITLELLTTSTPLDVYPAGNDATFIVSRNNLSIICSKLINENSATLLKNTTKPISTEEGVKNVNNITKNLVNINNITEELNEELNINLVNITNKEQPKPTEIILQNNLTNSSTGLTLNETNLMSEATNVTKLIMNNNTSEYQNNNGISKKMLFVFSWLLNKLMNI